MLSRREISRRWTRGFTPCLGKFASQCVTIRQAAAAAAAARCHGKIRLDRLHYRGSGCLVHGHGAACCCHRRFHHHRQHNLIALELLLLNSFVVVKTYRQDTHGDKIKSSESAPYHTITNILITNKRSIQLASLPRTLV